ISLKSLLLPKWPGGFLYRVCDIGIYNSITFSPSRLTSCQPMLSSLSSSVANPIFAFASSKFSK
ncbi:MAG: hypothetical protein OQJ78_02810, partial [Ignavibacteriaceae bacterium]|nr:hypothetical protein [Ignavibacteriaceae bacterium]